MVRINKKDGTVGVEALPWRVEPTPKELITCDGKEVFKQLLDFYQDHMVFQKPIEYILNAIWDMHTYHMDKWDSTPYLGYFGAGNEKGKSRALSIHSMVAYRGSPISIGTLGGFKKVLTDGATILIDQAENLFYDSGHKTFMYNVFTSGYTRDFKALQLDHQDFDNYDCRLIYGAKAYCMQEDGKDDNPIKQRTIPFHMLQGVPKVKSMRRNSESIKNLNEIFYKLHYLKLQKYKELDYDTGLDLRPGELVDPLLLAVQLYNIPSWVEKKLYIYAFEKADENRDISTDTLPATIYFAIPKVMEITKQFTATHIKSWILQNCSNEYNDKNLSEDKVGKNLHLMGLKNRNFGKGYGRMYDMDIPENIQRLEALGRQYNNDSSVEAMCNKFELENNITPDTLKTVYERYADYCEYKSMQDLARKMHDDNIEDISIIEPKEIEMEYPCPICAKMIVGNNPSMICDECDKTIGDIE